LAVELSVLGVSDFELSEGGVPDSEPFAVPDPDPDDFFA